MNASEVLDRAKREGVTLTLTGLGGLKASAARPISDGLQILLAEHKAEIVALLCGKRNDDRITCRQCFNLLASGVCLPTCDKWGCTRPDPDLPRRCQIFKPLANEPDQRTGAERWRVKAHNLTQPC